MKFSQVINHLLQGERVKRKIWGGYWEIERHGAGDVKVMMHCRDGKVMEVRETEDILFTLSNVAADDWEIADATNCKLITDGPTDTFSFSEAIRQLKQGKRVCRKGWNGKKQYIELAVNVSYINPAGECTNVNHDQMGNKAIAFVGTSGVQLGWLASQADMLSEDWQVVE